MPRPQGPQFPLQGAAPLARVWAGLALGEVTWAASPSSLSNPGRTWGLTT